MDIFKIFGTIALDNDAAIKGIDATSKKASNLTKTMKASFEKIGKFAVQAGTVIGTGLSAGMGVLLKNTYSQYADYEQLLGGVKKLFGDSWEQVSKNANEAYKNQGMSANEYMSTVTSFSASLVNALNGDTAAAAKMADTAIQDMADNANTFGTDIGLIQNAYQGFAKQNYTMLDNLKLGYGGNQEEMARLINDSGVLGSAMKVTAETVNDVSFDVIIAAINTIQQRMGIAGTTAMEAADTIAGSFASFKASWSNLLVGLANEDDIEPLVDMFFDAGQTVWNNIKKVAPKIMNNLSDAFRQAGQKVKHYWSSNVWPGIQNFAKAKLGIELPEWSTVTESVVSWWNNNVKPIVDGAINVVFGLGRIDSDTSGTVTAGEMITWWGKVWDLVETTFKVIFGIDKLTDDPDGTTTAGELETWWSKVLEKFKGVLTITLKLSTAGLTSALYKLLGIDISEEEIASLWDATQALSDGLDVSTGATPTWSDIEGALGGGEDTNSHGTTTDTGTSYEEVIEGLRNGTFHDPMGIFGAPSSNNVNHVFTELQSLIAEMKTVLDPTTLKEAIVTATSEGLSGATITTGNVTLNDGALVGRILPRINLALGQMTAREMRGVM